MEKKSSKASQEEVSNFIKSNQNASKSIEDWKNIYKEKLKIKQKEDEEWERKCKFQNNMMGFVIIGTICLITFRFILSLFQLNNTWNYH